MCEFLSAVKVKGNKGDYKYYYLTNEQVNSSRGLALKNRFPGEGELIGHSAIRAYYRFPDTKGKNWEQTDFSSPANFPPEIVKAIKAGEFRGLGTPVQLLSELALAEYQKVEQPALAEYEKVKQPALAEYQKVKQPALAEYQKVEQPAWEKYDKVRQQALAEYQKVTQPAQEEYDKVRQQAQEEYDKVRQQAFWDLFQDSKNRSPAWRG